ncbi:MAG: hypothetical protein A3Q59_04085 [Methanomethylophilus alvi]|nr:MAG: hypothetical protein A3Q59_04085 [Methanomethylophilus alvi]
MAAMRHTETYAVRCGRNKTASLTCCIEMHFVAEVTEAPEARDMLAVFDSCAGGYSEGTGIVA